MVISVTVEPCLILLLLDITLLLILILAFLFCKLCFKFGHILFLLFLLLHGTKVRLLLIGFSSSTSTTFFILLYTSSKYPSPNDKVTCDHLYRQALGLFLFLLLQVGKHGIWISFFLTLVIYYCIRSVNIQSTKGCRVVTLFFCWGFFSDIGIEIDLLFGFLFLLELGEIELSPLPLSDWDSFVAVEWCSIYLLILNWIGHTIVFFV